MFSIKINPTCHIRNSKINYSNSNKNILNNIGRLANYDQNCISFFNNLNKMYHIYINQWFTLNTYNYSTNWLTKFSLINIKSILNKLKIGNAQNWYKISIQFIFVFTELGFLDNFYKINYNFETV